MKEFEQQQLAQKEQKLKQRRHRLGRQLRSHMLERASPSPTPTPGRDMSHAPDGASAANESAGRGGAGAQAAGGPKQGGPRGAAAKAVGAAGVVEAPVEDEGVLSDEHHSVLTGSPKLASCAAGSAAGSTNAPRAPPAPPLRLSSLTLPGAERPAASEGSVRQGGAAAVGAGEAQSGGPRGATLTRTPTTTGPVPDSDGDCSVGSTSGAAPRSTPGTPRSFGAPSSPFAGRGGARGAWNVRGGGAAAPAAVFSEVAARAGVGSLSSTAAPPPDAREAAPPAAAAAGVAVNAAVGQDGAASAGRGQAEAPVLEVDLPTGVPQRQAALQRLEAQQQQQLQLARERGSSARAAEAGRSARQRKDAIAALAAQEQQRLGIDSPTAAAAAKADAERSALPSGEAKAAAADGSKAGPRPQQRGQEHARAAAAGAGADGLEPQLQPKTAGAGGAQKVLQADRRAPQGGGAGGPAGESAEDEEGVMAVVTQRGDQGADSAAAKEQADAGAADGGCAKTSTITVKRLLRETTPSRIPPAPAPPQEWGAQGGQAGLLSRVKSIPAPQKNA
ncbi:hypothetical protein MNEG_4977 [Monoraphidium neglectum]|uniref:Uncharacterized protein n=1 Tax=Monoraphidium neglectum TaxID=145388 RepID=A0A0D2MIY0_9CHLO|nr:hypothetical protein MNEG_4977 [Monoraphidium neglectum]KIZ02975.1 hypothetical protein MNEG_4977 [Monoraphidium neglectum]|eukprot:XP_013901994.1 hypothetical protein MNEG_4977 [Monoraphidium neglectum]